ncbi:MAG: hydantoinase B/oxoprolinase family protein, partial [Geminicoccaceae bacterium]
DPQVTTAYNVPTGGLRHPWLTLKLMHLIASYDDTVPLNYGLFENVTVSVPKGTILNPEFPAAVGVRHATAIRINDTIVGAIAKALPGLTPAPSGGTVVPTVLAEADEASGARKVTVIQSLVGGTGARPGADGVDGRDSGLANLFNTPLERTEADCGVVIEEYGLRPDSGGPGQWRGGTGLVMSFRILRSGSAVLGRGLERFVFRPWGVAGGGAGARCRVLVNADTPHARDLGKLDVYEAEEGDLITILTAGGGGFGDPFTRDPEAALRDVRAGFVTVEAAARDYGVAVREGQLDLAATTALRASAAARPDFGFGPERDAWERVFDDALMNAMVERLLRLPVQRRHALRRRLFEAALPGLRGYSGVDIGRLITDPAAQREALADAMATWLPD